MKLKDQIPDHALSRAAQRAGMVDEISSRSKLGFLKSMVDEWDQQYLDMGVPYNKIDIVRSMSTRVREFFGWKIGLEIIQAYRIGNAANFHKILTNSFQASDDMFSPMDIEAFVDQIPTNKTIDKDGLMQKVKNVVQTLRTNPDGIREMNTWIRKISYHFYDLGVDKKISPMSGRQVLEEFKKIK